jgi:hypothetical protein
MSIKNYQATQDNTISNAYRPLSATKRVSDINFGLTDNLEVYSLYGTVTASTSDNEKTRALIKFDTSRILTDRTNAVIPATGSVSFYLKLKNYPHTSTNPVTFTLVATPSSRQWSEGYGESFEDMGNKVGSNWLTASSNPTVVWTTAGGDLRTSSISSQAFTTGDEDFEVNVTSYVESILSGELTDYGLVIQLTSSQETAAQSYYKKNFYSRHYDDLFKRPFLQARFNDSLQDRGGNFFLSSSRLAATENDNTIYLYNYVRGNLVNIPLVGTGKIFVSVYSGSTTAPTGSKLSLPSGGGVFPTSNTNVTGTYVSKGIYSASFSFNSSSLSNIFAVWHSGSIEYHTSSLIEPSSRPFTNQRLTNRYYLSLTNLKEKYLQNQTSRLRLFVRNPSLSPTVQTTAVATMNPTIIEKAYYKIVRKSDNLLIVSYGTGSGNEEFSRLSYDSKGNYFDLDFSNFVAGTDYTISFVFYEGGQYREQIPKFNFKVV